MFLEEPITGRVARVVDRHSLAINVGSEHGVSKGMYFAVVSDEPEVILNPDNEEPIGKIPRIKIKLKVIDIFAKMSIVGTYETYFTGGGLNSGIGDVFGPRVERLEKLNTDEPLIKADQSKISVGDTVIQIEDD